MCCITRTAERDGSLSGEHGRVIRWLGTCQVFFFLFGGILAGPLTDRFGPQLLLVTGAFLSSLGCAASSFAGQFWFFLGTQGVLLGMGASLGFTPAIACIMQCIGSRRATCVGVALSGASAGAILWPVVVRIIAETKAWKIVWLALAVSQLLLLSVAALLVRQPSILLSSASQARQDYSPLVRSSSERSRPFLNLAVFSLPSYALSIAGHFFIWVGFLYLFFYLPEWTNLSGISVAVQIHMPSIISGSAFVGNLLLPFLADVTGRYEIMVLCAFSGSVSLLGSILVRNPTALLLVAGIYGFTTGGAIALQAPVLVEAIDEPEAFGTVLGQGLAAIAPAALIGPPLYGLILRAPEGGLACAQVVAGFCMVIGGILLIYARLCLGRTFSHG
ncbi:MFS general substrate transporter [Microstroma glucosiphilum]|uniref:MFS general substrate transporter n=1 Tax=Pseudomicrostroma glucosiphilum TaxID=1684307 RepID=A0A316UIA7_9BASI|nr:MFS general substrate transporter [Pseudomicrostroma glucosiphilum]PWN23673.1 MFS general substrate transporter [Pseudomicrostroma glucosiphilum]